MTRDELFKVIRRLNEISDLEGTTPTAYTDALARVARNLRYAFAEGGEPLSKRIRRLSDAMLLLGKAEHYKSLLAEEPAQSAIDAYWYLVGAAGMALDEICRCAGDKKHDYRKFCTDA